jgi:exodeoxyribonuclease V alpha subunit
MRNGSLGRVVSIKGESVIVDFDGTEHKLSGMALDDLTLAYAITVHKCKGSGFRRVVIPIQKTRLLDRPLVYTAVTRATNLAVMVGDAGVVREALRRSSQAERRETALGLLLDMPSGLTDAQGRRQN